MRLNSKVLPAYLPEPEQESVLRLGLLKLPPEQWLVVDEDFAQFHASKLEARQQFGDAAYQALPGSEPAQRELQRLVCDHLLNDHSNNYSVSSDSRLIGPGNQAWSLADHSLWNTSLWVQEDLCILEPAGNDFVLTAASVCSPSNWTLESKIGRTLDEIHGPVPGYGKELALRVNRLFANLRAEKPLLRFNWSVQHNAELFWRNDLQPRGSSDSIDLADRFWRVERQTLRRLPETGAIVFTIRIFIHSFAALTACPEALENLRRILARLPADQKTYKGLLAL